MYPSTLEEICFFIDSLNPKKAFRKLDVETKFVKFGKVLIFDRVGNFFDNLIEKRMYPSCLKIAEVIQFLKRVILMWLQITDLFLCYRNLINYLRN